MMRYFFTVDLSNYLDDGTSFILPFVREASLVCSAAVATRAAVLNDEVTSTLVCLLFYSQCCGLFICGIIYLFK